MKRFQTVTVWLTVLLLFCPTIHAQKSVDQLFNDFSKEENVQHVGIGGFTMTIAGLFHDVMGVKGIEVLSFDECDNAVKERLNREIAALKDSRYETMISVNENKERTKILVKIEDELIRELIVVTSGDDPALVRIKGKIKPSDIEKIVNENSKKN
ncbi:MAG: DUF4252 domain-containing protein [Tannerella sp.]|jgi:hypothetical protein|nr:DUF4252 domain-containing protein [Tannerella sp.]